ncbi:uncharacterized protein METZ01_LOCUS207275 [marine metagenome]|uniref:Putative regulatory protein FmdB zinc ribbon domain-containing protein n=1 Tax=marine metagenome TaxID=408172 RepID=A0A382EWW8_9ZZZZ
MPMYDYKCNKCGTLFEELVLSSTVADDQIKCPKCGGSKSKRQLSAPFISMNSGFEPACEKPACSTPVGYT